MIQYGLNLDFTAHSFEFRILKQSCMLLTQQDGTVNRLIAALIIIVGRMMNPHLLPIHVKDVWNQLCTKKPVNISIRIKNQPCASEVFNFTFNALRCKKP